MTSGAHFPELFFGPQPLDVIHPAAYSARYPVSSLHTFEEAAIQRLLCELGESTPPDFKGSEYDEAEFVN